MRKYISILLCIVLLFSLCACSVTINTGSDTNQSTSSEADINSEEQSTNDIPSDVTVSSSSYPEPQSRYNSLDEIDISQYKLIMVNYWRPTCGFCVDEMPDLESLWQKYKNNGLLIVGVSTESDDVDQTIAETGVTYPIIIDTDVSSDITKAMPQTVFFNSNGQMLPAMNSESTDIEDGRFIGSADFDSWESTILQRLNDSVIPSNVTTINDFSQSSQQAQVDNTEDLAFFVVVRNDMFENINDFYMKPSNTSDWGQNTISSGGRYDYDAETQVGYYYYADEGYLHDIFFRTRSGQEYEFNFLDFSEADTIIDNNLIRVTIHLQFNDGVPNAWIE